jgi:hypothetical protein
VIDIFSMVNISLYIFRHLPVYYIYTLRSINKKFLIL